MSFQNLEMIHSHSVAGSFFQIVDSIGYKALTLIFLLAYLVSYLAYNALDYSCSTFVCTCDLSNKKKAILDLLALEPWFVLLSKL